MPRQRIFDTRNPGEIPGLVSLTEPGDCDRVTAIVDIPILGAPAAGKTQFVVSAVRTVRAHAPDIEGEELASNRALLRTVMNAQKPSPSATEPSSVPHYVFRVGAESLLEELGFWGRVSLLLRVGSWSRDLFLSVVVATAAFALLVFWRQAIDAAVIAGTSVAAAVAAIAGWSRARRRIASAGDVEIVFWDVAGEHVYSEKSADYYGFLETLSRERKRRARPWRAYAFAPVLVCNPLTLGTEPEESAFARLRQLVPIFAALNEPHPRALIAVNHFYAATRVCEPDRDRDDIVTVRVEHREGEALTCEVRREVVRKLCVDAEDGSDGGARITHLRFDAGTLISARAGDGDVVTCEYREGPGGFEGEARREFFAWLADTAYCASHRPRFAPVIHPAPDLADDTDDRWSPTGEHAAVTLEGMTRVVQQNRRSGWDGDDARAWSGTDA